MNRGTYILQNKISINGNTILKKMCVLERHPESSLNTVLYYDVDDTVLTNKDIKTVQISCNECNKKVIVKKIIDPYIINRFLCKSCRGRGSRNGFFGKTHSVETKKKLSDNSIGELNSFYGKKHTDEYKKKRSAERKGVWYVGKKNPMYGKSAFDMMVTKYGKEQAEIMWAEKRIQQSIRMTTNNPFKGKTHNNKTKEKIRRAAKEWSHNMKTEHPDDWNNYIQKNI